MDDRWIERVERRLEHLEQHSHAPVDFSDLYEHLERLERHVAELERQMAALGIGPKPEPVGDAYRRMMAERLGITG